MTKKIKNIELIHFLKDLKAIKNRVGLPEESFENIVKHIHEIIGQTSETIENRLEGLSKEDEFLLISLILGNTEQITRLDQKVHIKTDYVIPDFLFAVKVPESVINTEIPLAQRFFIEVKKITDESQEFIITLEYLNKIENYSKLYNLPLYFAIKVNLSTLSQWFLVSSNILKEKSKIENRKIFNRKKKQNCFVFDILDMIKYNYLSLWLSDYSIGIQEGFKINKTYTNNQKGYIHEKNLGTLISVEATVNKIHKKVFLREADLRNALFLYVCKNLSEGQVKSYKTKNNIIISYQADQNYLIPFYHVILKTWLYMKNQIQKREGIPETNDIPYHLNTFSDIDYQIIFLIKDILSEMSNEDLITLIKLIPNHVSRE